MKVIVLESGKTEDFNKGYAARLIEQGRAILCPKTVKPEKKEKPVKETKSEEKKEG